MKPPRRYTGRVAFRPVPFARAHTDRHGRRYNPAKYEAWKAAAGTIGRSIRRGRPLLEGPLGIELVVGPDAIDFEVFELGLPTNRDGLRGDLDNYAKALLDALQNGVLYKDDRQIETINVRFTNVPEEPQP